MVGVGAAEGKEQTEQLDPSQAAKLIESSLASEIFTDDGQLAFKHLVRSTLDTTLPRLHQSGQLGQARYVKHTARKHLLCYLQVPSNQQVLQAFKCEQAFVSVFVSAQPPHFHKRQRRLVCVACSEAPNCRAGSSSISFP